MCGSRPFLTEMWPFVVKLMDRWLNVIDAEGDGVIRGPQPNTYDCAIYGANTFMGTLYIHERSTSVLL